MVACSRNHVGKKLQQSIDCWSLLLVLELSPNNINDLPAGSNHPATIHAIVSGREISHMAESLRGIATSIFHNIRSMKIFFWHLPVVRDV